LLNETQVDAAADSPLIPLPRFLRATDRFLAASTSITKEECKNPEKEGYNAQIYS
jgi:hypothetical protein